MTQSAAAGSSLAGLRVIDMTRVMAGPMSGQILGDLGADVIKIEDPEKGDLSRTSLAADLRGRDGKPTGIGAFYLASNRNKRSITIDFAKPAGRALVVELVATADILLENYKSGTLARYGLDYGSLARINPRLVYCSLTGYGQTGPKSHQPGYDPIFQAQCGFMSVTGFPPGDPRAGPVKAGAHVVDLVAGYHAVIGILAAIRERDQVSGLGQHLDIALYDAGLAMLSSVAQQYLMSGVPPTAQGNANQTGGPSAVFECADRPAFFLTGDSQWPALCGLLGVPALVADPRFATSQHRHGNHRELCRILEERTRLWKRDDLLAALTRINVAAGPMNDVAEAFADPQAVHRNLAVPMPHPDSDDLRVVASPIRLSRTPVRYERHPPRVGEQTDEILKEVLGYDAERIAGLRNDGAL